MVMALLAGIVPGAAQGPSAPGLALYHRLQSVGLDPAQVYAVRDGHLDREDIHLSFTEGVIGFLQPVDGRVTGAFFVGEGQVLLVPPDHTERQSLGLFTGQAVLNEPFTIAYLRFDDGRVPGDLAPALRPAEDAAGFLDRYGAVVRNLTTSDALRMLVSLSRDPAANRGGFLRARLGGVTLGNFDVVLDPDLEEQVFAGQATPTPRGVFYDQWTSFLMRSLRGASTPPARGDKLRITAYRLKTEVKPPTDISAEATLTLEVLAGGDRAVVFELSRSLRVSGVWLGEDAATPLEVIQNEAAEGTQQARRSNDLIAVVFPAPLAAGSRVTLRFRYAGPAMSDAGGGLIHVGTRGAWYPHRGAWMSDFDLEFRTPLEWRLLATGKRVAQEVRGGEEFSRWVSEQPIPLAGFNLGKYVEARATSVSGTVVESYATRSMERAYTQKQETMDITIARPGYRRRAGQVDSITIISRAPDPARNAQIVADQAVRTIDYLSPRIGPFPFATLSLTQNPGTDSQGWPGLVYLSSYVFLTPAERWRGRIKPDAPAEILYNRVMAAHETAHQWWGDNIFWRSYRDQWIMEALANYCALMQLEADDPDSFRILMETYRDQLLEPYQGRPMKEAGAVTLGGRLNSSKFPESYDIIAYGRGTWLMHMLRHMLRDASQHPPVQRRPARRAVATGLKPLAPPAPPASLDPDALFFAALRRLQERFAGKVMSTQDLRAAFEEQLPPSLWFEDRKSLDWFFDGWVGGVAVPRYELDKVRINQSTATAVLRQKDAPEQLVTSVPIYAELADGKLAFVERVFADGAETELKLTVPPGTKSLVLDPFATVLRAQ
jgi:hypothetical protein